LKIGITCYPTYGGSGIIATELGKELAERGHDVHFISYALPLRLPGALARIHFHEVEVSNYPLFDHPPYTLALASKMADIASSKGLDLLHCHYAIPHSVSAFLAQTMLKPLQLPFVTTLHGTDITLVGSNPSYLPITRFSIDRSNGVTAVSRFLKEETRRVLGATNEIEVIYNFVNCDKYRPMKEHPLKKFLAQNNEKILIHVSNFRPVKHPLDVVEIFMKVLKKIPSILLMVGDGPERSSAERLVRRYGIEESVHFTGKQADIEEFMGIADVLLLPSETESFGLVALEAMACEVPVVATNVGGLPEVVRDGVDGYLLETGRIDLMAQRTLDILQNSSLRLKMGRNAREAAKRRFSVSKVVQAYEAFYYKTLNQ